MPKFLQIALPLLALVLAGNLYAKGPDPMALLDDKAPLNSGETFSYSVQEDAAEPVALYVDSEGKANIPLLGEYEVVGKTPKVLAYELKEALEEEYYYQATVLVDRALAAQGRVFISGEVNSTGSVQLPPTQVWTLSKAILSAGGFTDRADRARVAIIRKDPASPGKDQRHEYDIGRMFETGDFSADPIIRPGDLLVVASMDLSARITVSGAVNSPGIYNIPRSDFTVSEAVMSAGGLTLYGNPKKVRLIRTDANGKRTIKKVDLKKILEDGILDLDLVVQPNDTINIPERFINF